MTETTNNLVQLSDFLPDDGKDLYWINSLEILEITRLADGALSIVLSGDIGITLAWLSQLEIIVKRQRGRETHCVVNLGFENNQDQAVYPVVITTRIVKVNGYKYIEVRNCPPPQRIQIRTPLSHRTFYF